MDSSATRRFHLGSERAAAIPAGLSLGVTSVGYPVGPRILLLDDSNFEVFELNLGLNHTIPTWWSPWLFSLEHQFTTAVGAGQRRRSARGCLIGSVGLPIRDGRSTASSLRFAMTLHSIPRTTPTSTSSLAVKRSTSMDAASSFWQPDPHFMVGIVPNSGIASPIESFPAGFVWLPDDRSGIPHHVAAVAHPILLRQLDG